MKGAAYLAKEPSNNVAKYNGFVGLIITGWGGDTGGGPEVALPLVEISVGRFGVEEQDAGGAVDEPPTVERFDASAIHSLNGLDEARVLGCKLFNLDLSLWQSQYDVGAATSNLGHTEALLRGPSRV